LYTVLGALGSKQRTVSSHPSSQHPRHIYVRCIIAKLWVKWPVGGKKEKKEKKGERGKREEKRKKFYQLVLAHIRKLC